jgi:eukaryotic-like serine/threonine-protein kinase
VVATVHGAADTAVPMRRPAATADQQFLGPADPVEAAVALTKARAAVLAAGDPAALVGVERVGGAAHAADLALLARVRGAGLRIEGLSARAVSARMVDAVAATGDAATGPGARPTTARVEVTSGLTSYRRVTGDGAIGAEVPAQPVRTVVLTLDWTPGGWRVAAVADRPLGGSGA